MDALREKNTSQIDRLLAADFEVWSAERSGPTSRHDWQEAAASNPAARIRNLTVREFGETAVVSFLLESGATRRTATSKVLFVIDIWNATAGTLAVRYVSTPAAPAPDDRRHE